MAWKLCPTNSRWSWFPVKCKSTLEAARISLVRSAEASNARVSDWTSVLSQSRSRVVIFY